MADISVTAANVKPGANARKVEGVAGETIAQGKVVYLSSSNKWLLADSDSATAAANDGTAVALTGSSLDQPIVVQKMGDITIGGTVTAGDPYFVSSTAGGICPYGDLSAGEKVVQIGIAKSATVIALDFQNSGVTK